MAKATWLTTNPEQGSGNGTISNSASAHTGRVVRETTVTVTASGVSTPATYKVTQTAKSEFVSFDNGTSMAAAKGGGTVTVSGKSNSASLTFAFVGSSESATIAANYTAGGVSTANGVAISGDPGASAEYAFSVQLSLPENTTIEQVDRVLKVTADGAQAAQITIEQAAGDATISVEPTSITIPQAGTAVSVNVSSNTSWTVS